MDEPDLYDDIIGGTLEPAYMPHVEALLEVGVHRRVLRLPVNGVRPLQAVRDAAHQLLKADKGLLEAIGTARLVFQRRSDKFDSWVDIGTVRERPVKDGEHLRALLVPVLEAGEVLSGEEGEAVERARKKVSEEKRQKEKRRHKRRRHRSESEESDRRRRRKRRRRHPSSESDSSVLTVSSDSEDERRRRRKESRRRKRDRHRHSRRHRRRHRSRSPSSDSDSDRSRSDSSDPSSVSGGDRKPSTTSRRQTSGSDASRPARIPPPAPKRRVAPPRDTPSVKVSTKAWQHMDPEFAEQLRQYERDRAREDLKRHLSNMDEISEGTLNSSASESVDAKDGVEMKDMSELGLRVLDRLTKLRREFGGGDGAPNSADGTAKGGVKKKKKRKISWEEEEDDDDDDDDDDGPEPTLSKGGQVYAAFLNLESKHPVMALNEYCTARLWEAPFYHLTEQPSESRKGKVFTAAVRVNKRMYTFPEPVTSKKDGKKAAALHCLQKLGVLKGGASHETEVTSVEWPCE